MTREVAIDSLDEAFVVLATTRVRRILTVVEFGKAYSMPRLSARLAVRGCASKTLPAAEAVRQS